MHQGILPVTYTIQSSFLLRPRNPSSYPIQICMAWEPSKFLWFDRKNDRYNLRFCCNMKMVLLCVNDCISRIYRPLNGIAQKENDIYKRKGYGRERERGRGVEWYVYKRKGYGRERERGRGVEWYVYKRKEYGRERERGRGVELYVYKRKGYGRESERGRGVEWYVYKRKGYGRERERGWGVEWYI